MNWNINKNLTTEATYVLETDDKQYELYCNESGSCRIIRWTEASNGDHYVDSFHIPHFNKFIKMLTEAYERNSGYFSTAAWD